MSARTDDGSRSCALDCQGGPAQLTCKGALGDCQVHRGGLGVCERR
ncbi:hypothetical protein [Pendulispora albinea]|uniref:Uncharacterized protein n=1 Tax=Pendulispora albinea TaxID=2741071 RepID=A0ABZ2M994_9BACT